MTPERYNEPHLASVMKSADAFLDRMPDQGHCVYCGDPADQWDHVVPHSFLTNGHTRSWSSGVLPSCGECNRAASNAVHDTLDDRLFYICASIKRKYRKLLASPNWIEGELRELGPSLQAATRDMMRQKRWITGRLRYLDRGYFDQWFELRAQDLAADRERRAKEADVA